MAACKFCLVKISTAPHSRSKASSARKRTPLPESRLAPESHVRNSLERLLDFPRRTAPKLSLNTDRISLHKLHPTLPKTHEFFHQITQSTTPPRPHFAWTSPRLPNLAGPDGKSVNHPPHRESCGTSSAGRANASAELSDPRLARLSNPWSPLPGVPRADPPCKRGSASQFTNRRRVRLRRRPPLLPRHGRLRWLRTLSPLP